MPKLTSRGRVTIPIKVRSALGVRPGDRIEFVEIEKSKFIIVGAMPSVGELKGIVRGRRGRRSKRVSTR